MKTLTDVKKEIDQLISDGRDIQSIEKRRLSKIKGRIKWLRMAESYLSSDCNKNYIDLSLPLTKIKLRNIAALCPFDRADTNPLTKKLVKEWDKKEGVTKLKEQIKFMNYLNS